MDTNIELGTGFVLGCVFASLLWYLIVGHAVGREKAHGVEVAFESETGTTTRIRAGKPSDLHQILRMMREFNPQDGK